jgi:O-antigen ligase
LNTNALHQKLRPADATFFFAALLAVSMLLSPFLLSVSMWGLVAVALWQSALEHRTPHVGTTLLAGLRAAFRRFFRRPELVLLMLLLIVPAVSGLWSDDRAFWLERTRVRIPFFVLPWAFANLPRLSARQHRLLLYLLVWVLVVMCIGIAVYYSLHRQTILVGLSEGRPIPVPRNHIRFNLVLATGILAGGWLWLQRFSWRYPWERKALGIALLFLAGFIHFLSVRSGLVALYVALLFTVARFVWRTRRLGIGLAALALLAVVPIIALKTLPSLQQRINYMRWDWQQYQHKAGDNYSDSERWVSFAAGLAIWREHPWLGVGTGDLPAEIDRKVRSTSPEYAKDPRLPHNQFIYILACTGLVGLVLSLIALLGPIATGPWRHRYLFAVFQVIVFVSFLVEYTLETSIGVAFYLFYMLWFMRIAEEDSTVQGLKESTHAS